MNKVTPLLMFDDQLEAASAFSEGLSLYVDCRDQAEVDDYWEKFLRPGRRRSNGRSAVTAEMALKLGAAFGTSPEFWLNAQKACDLYRAAMRSGPLPESLLNAG